MEQTAVEFLVDELNKEMGLISFVTGAEESYKSAIFSIIEKAKQKENEQKQSEYTRGFDDGYQRKNQEFDYLRGKNHSCQDNFKNPFKHELNKSE